MNLRKLFDNHRQLEPHPENSRRRFLKSGMGVCALFALPLATPYAHAKIMRPMEKRLSFLNLHTGERVKSTYWAEGQYIPESLHAIRNVLRDHRTGDLHEMDSDLFDMLHQLQHRLNSNKEFHVISAYRSPASNAMLASRSNGVAKGSLHTQGRAIDIRMPGHALSDLRMAALSLEAGGVGYYPASDFVHLDTGRFRSWGG
ncbi:MAG: DUF882 domain-containing protein [Pseudomonadota bacterium]